MPHLKTAVIKFYSKMSEFGSWEHKKVKISVNADGKFYTNLDPEYRLATSSVLEYRYNESNKKIKVSDGSLDALEKTLSSIFETHYSPKVTKEPVIIYNIESHISFAEDKDGNIFPNAGYDGAEWSNHRPHSILGKLSPIEYLDKYNQEKNYSV
jgi:hypothetical protein